MRDCSTSGHPVHGCSSTTSTEGPSVLAPRAASKLASQTPRVHAPTEALDPGAIHGKHSTISREGDLGDCSGSPSTALHKISTGSVGPAYISSAMSVWSQSSQASATMEWTQTTEPSATESEDAVSETTDATSTSPQESDAFSDQEPAREKAVPTIGNSAKKMYACQDCDRSESLICCTCSTHAAPLLYRQD